jgi:KDO2-lipid IV(A) lauroyltransferase
MTRLATRVVIFLMWLLHFLPLRAIAAFGNAVGAALFWLIPERRHVTRTNLAKCFPQMPERERERLARAHFRAFCRSFVERGILWWSPRGRIERLVRIDGVEHLRALAGRPVILFAPHFVGLDVPISRLSMDFPVAGMYSRQKDPLLDELLCRGRTRFGGKLILRQHGLRPSIRAIKAGMPYYFLPDLDFGPRGSVFAPFFGVPAATATGLAYIARSTGAAVLPCVTRMLPGGGGYVARLYPPWTDYPSGDDVADARRMLAFIEERVLEMPEQYHWLHKRFKTRPPGEKGFY